MFAWLRRGEPDEGVARIYENIVAQARRPEFYRDLGVADSLDGRFDMLTLHAMLILRRFKSEPDRASETGQALFDYMFVDMDRSLREVGVSDISIGKRVKQMGAAFLGRVAAYEAGLVGSGAELEDALIRNVYRDQAPDGDGAKRLAAYMRMLDDQLRDMSLEPILAGDDAFVGVAP
jgi:cytochrome b pre-mRNA-processing protein 3